eukprot:SAG11_NODE_7172_length_1184_cov_0.799078_2_plen_125_part_01
MSVLAVLQPCRSDMAVTHCCSHRSAGNTVIWGTVSQTDDDRTLHVGWFNGPGSSNCQTVPRELTYDPHRQKLLSLPVAEVAALRTGVLAMHKTTSVPAGQPLSLTGTGGSTTSFDLELTVKLPPA